jgi:two-component system, chemotaxis family, sensor kinase Cph1
MPGWKTKLYMNTDFDSDFCGTLPLHIINQVQPYGFLLVLDKSDLRIIQASDNLHTHTGYSVKELLEQPLHHVVPEDDIVKLRARTSSPAFTEKLPLRIRIKTQEGGQRNVLAFAVDKGEYILLEVEDPDSGLEPASFVSVYEDIKYLIARIQSATGPEELMDIVSAGLKRLSGFDKVMVYRFDESWNGKVVAEAREEDMESYLGLTFPASDIPRQARDMYLRSPYRFIPDREYEPVKLVPVINPVTSTFTDLSDCNLRGVAAVHLEYLSNMQVMASMSTRILYDSRLWGLLSCHHRSSRRLSYEMCAMFEVVSNFLSARLAVLERQDSYRQSIRLNQLNTLLMEQVYAASGIMKGLSANENLLAALGATGAAIFSGHQVELIGRTPSFHEIKSLVYWMQGSRIKETYVTNRLPSLVAEAGKYKHIASGMIVLPLAAGQGGWVMGFRPEVVQTVEWGGNPNDAIQFTADRKSYHPRNSFETWKETVTEVSLPWKQAEVEAAEQLRHLLVEYVLKAGGPEHDS